MSEKGGEKVENSISLRAVIISLMVVLAGIAVVLCIVQAGVQIGRKYEQSISSNDDDEEDISDVISVQYETKTYSYQPQIQEGKGTESNYRELLKKLGGEEKYYLIKSNTEYEKVISELKLLDGVQGVEDFDLSSTFFNSGSVILLTAEKPGLSYFGIESIIRNSDYQIFIETSAIDANDTIDVSGKAILIKLENIQPKYVEVKMREE